MEKITKEQFLEDRVNCLKAGPPSNEILEVVRTLKINEGLKITFEEWRKHYNEKSKPANVLGQVFRKDREGIKFSIRTLKDKTAFIVLRIK